MASVVVLSKKSLGKLGFSPLDTSRGMPSNFFYDFGGNVAISALYSEIWKPLFRNLPRSFQVKLNVFFWHRSLVALTTSFWAEQLLQAISLTLFI
jgi:hypothetical protein